jgi:hypothetical protein
MLTSLSKRTDKDYNKVVGIPRPAFAKIVDKWKSSLRIHPGPQTTLSPPAQVLTFLLHLRHYNKPLLMAVYMDISHTTLRKTLQLLAPFFYTLFAPLISFGTYEERRAAAKKYFNEFITYLCDGSTQEIHSTKDIAMEGNLFSAKNHMHAITILIFCSPTKRLLHLTPCIYGAVKDDDLLIRTAPDWAPKLTTADKGMGDSGFRLSEETKRKNPITRQFRIYTPTGVPDSIEYKQHSSIRIFVENMIRILKRWESVSQKIREKVKGNDDFLQEQSKKWHTVGGVEVWKMDGCKDL